MFFLRNTFLVDKTRGFWVSSLYEMRFLDSHDIISSL